MHFFRYAVVDFTALTSLTQLTYIVPSPKPIDSFYQFVNPFTIEVWYVTFITLLICCFLVFVVTKYYKQFTNFENTLLEQKSFVDFITHPIGMFLAPMLDKTWLNKLWRQTSSGSVTIGTIALGGFFVINFYKSLLLSHLTAVAYEKPIETIEG